MIDITGQRLLVLELAKQARVLDPLMRRVIAAGGYEVVTTRNMLVTKPVSAVARMSTLLVA